MSQATQNPPNLRQVKATLYILVNTHFLELTIGHVTIIDFCTFDSKGNLLKHLQSLKLLSDRLSDSQQTTVNELLARIPPELKALRDARTWNDKEKAQEHEKELYRLCNIACDLIREIISDETWNIESSPFQQQNKEHSDPKRINGITNIMVSFYDVILLNHELGKSVDKYASENDQDQLKKMTQAYNLMTLSLLQEFNKWYEEINSWLPETSRAIKPVYDRIIEQVNLISKGFETNTDARESMTSAMTAAQVHLSELWKNTVINLLKEFDGGYI
jgi:hypothetical protein